MIEIEYKGVKIDRCSECGGIYLDDGELEQLMKPENAGVLGRLFSAFKD
ncbi:MAG: zf-TFIIB domain-containing protein [Deltaproteobacteria bacterium]|nr:zf-TFIIB domain-containing protein [Deltaproteobacteria bacterium]